MVGRSSAYETADIPSWSWVVAALGLMLVVGSAGFMLYRALAGDSSPPDFAIETVAVLPRGSNYLVQIRVANRGESVAAALVVEGELKEGAATVETSGITIGYVPAGSWRRAGLIFSRDPRKYDLQIQAKGYEQP